MEKPTALIGTGLAILGLLLGVANRLSDQIEGLRLQAAEQRVALERRLVLVETKLDDLLDRERLERRSRLASRR